VVTIPWLTPQSRGLRVLLGGVLANVDAGPLLEMQLDYKVMMLLGDLLRLGNVFRQKDLDFTMEIQAYSGWSRFFGEIWQFFAQKKNHCIFPMDDCHFGYKQNFLKTAPMFPPYMHYSILLTISAWTDIL
jgi:hypothetical protein